MLEQLSGGENKILVSKFTFSKTFFCKTLPSTTCDVVTFVLLIMFHFLYFSDYVVCMVNVLVYPTFSERYRDLIEAADTITEMNNSSEKVRKWQIIYNCISPFH